MVDDLSLKPGKLIPLPQGVVCFGPFRFDMAARRLYRGDVEVHLVPKALGVLEILLTRCGQTVGKDEFFETVWEDVNVSDESLTQAISNVRHVLGDSPQSPAYIQTVPGKGYRFIARVTGAPPVPVGTPTGDPAKASAHTPDVHDGGALRRSIEDNGWATGPVHSPYLVRAPDEPGAIRLRPWLWLAALVVAALAVGVVAGRYLPAGSTVSPPLTPRTFPLALPHNAIDVGRFHGLTISSDGTKVVFTASTPEHSGLWMIRTDADDSAAARAVPIEGTSGATDPFISPDGDWIGFVQGGELRKAPSGGGPALPIADLGVGGGNGAWSANDTEILFTESYVSGLWRVPARGGDPVQVTSLDPATGDVIGHGDPHFLPDGRHVLFTRWQLGGGLVVAVVDTETGKPEDLITDAFSPHYVSSGHIVFGHEHSIWSVPFDLSTRTVTGERTKLVDDVRAPMGDGYASFDVSDNGTLVHITRPERREMRTVVAVDFDGNERPLTTKAQYFTLPVVSPDGRKVAVRGPSANGCCDIFWIDLADGKLHRATNDAYFDHFPQWSGDSQSIIFGSVRVTGYMDLFSVLIEPLGAPEPVMSGTPHNKWPGSSHGTTLLYHHDEGVNQGWDVMELDLAKPGEASELMATEFSEAWPAISPDGTWIAFTGTRTGRQEVYVAPLDDLARSKWVSLDGGGSPKWSHDGRSVYYLDPRERRLMQAVVHRGPEAWVEEPRALPLDISGYERAWFDVLPHGSGFVFVKMGPRTPQELILALDWVEKLKTPDSSRR